MRLLLSSLLVLALVVPSAVAAHRQEPAPDAPRISIDEMKALVAKKGALVIDVRNMEEFGKGHIPGAMNIPYGQASEQEEQLRKEKRTIVLYCACPNDASAVRAAVEMTGLEIPNIKVLRGGWDEWVKRGERVEKTTSQ